MKIQNPTPNLVNQNILECLISFLDLTLPVQYKKFLLYCNGGYVEGNLYIKASERNFYIKSFFGIIPDYSYGILERLKIFKTRIPSNMFPIANDQYGNLFVISIRGKDYGKIYFWDHEMEANDNEEPDYSNLTLVADSFDEFINNLKSEDELDDN